MQKISPQLRLRRGRVGVLAHRFARIREMVGEYTHPTESKE